MLPNEPSEALIPGLYQESPLFSLMVTAGKTDSMLHFSYTDIMSESSVSQHAVQGQFHHIASPILHLFLHADVVCQADAVTEWQ